MELIEVREIFEKEFSSLVKKFQIYELEVPEAFGNKEQGPNRPGVYLYWHPTHKVILVGKSQSNSLKRSLNHIRDNTRKGDLEVGSLKTDKDARILLINIISDADLHWVLSLEALMEWRTAPAIPAGRMG